jgi:nicotinate-nucleotide pyrophosphorylase (carboxylating)
MTMTDYFGFTSSELARLAASDCARALLEDVGGGDLTAGLIDVSRRARAHVLAREAAIICGAPWVEATLRQLDPDVRLPGVSEGQPARRPGGAGTGGSAGC